MNKELKPIPLEGYEDYVIDEDGDVYSCVSVEMLIDKGYLKSFKNDKINNDTIIKLYKNNNSSKIISKEHFSNKDFNNKWR